MAANNLKQQSEQKLKENELKWSKPLMDAGWTVIPSIIIEKQQAFGLDATDMNILLHLSQYWWKHDKLPHPSVKTIAEALGVKARTIQRRIKRMEDEGFITRQYRKHENGGNETNRYSFEGLIKHATPHAQEKIDSIAIRKAAEDERKRRKKPKLMLAVDNK